MSTAAPLQNLAAKPKALSNSTHAGFLLQRKCACGSPTASLTGECAECKSKKRLQMKLAIGASNDPLEMEADRVADQVLSAPANPAVGRVRSHIQRFTGHASGQAEPAPASVDRVLTSPGRPLDSALRQDMEQRFGHDFSRVRVHSDPAAATSAHHIDAHAYTAGTDIVFGTGRFAPGTPDGRRLLAHELTHVIQQANSAAELVRPAQIIQREGSGFSPILEPKDLFRAYFAEMYVDEFDGIADRLLLAFKVHPNPVGYLQDVFETASDQIPEYEDNIAAAFVRRLTEDRLDALASSYHGRYVLSLLYVAMITGSVSDFERAQSTRVLFAKSRQYSPDDFARMAKHRGKGLPTRIFPVRFMRVTGGDYAPPLATLLDNGQVRVSYPQSVSAMSMFKNEVRTIGNFIGGDGDVISANEIVIIKDYERGTETPLPALALIDYSNQAIHSTTGKIVEVSIFAATLGVGGGAVAGGEAAAETAAVRFTSTAIWGARIAKAVRVMDVAANVIGVAAFVIDENRGWIIEKLGPAGRLLVRISDIANTAVAIYGLGRLAHAGFKIAKDFHAAASSARAGAQDLTNAEASIIDEIDNKLAQLSSEIDEQAAKTGKAASAAKQEPMAGAHADDAASSPGISKDVPEKPASQAAGDLDEIHASASAHKIPAQELERQSDTLAREAGDPGNVRAPEGGKFDAEMNAEGHRFERNRKARTWCRHSDKDCDLQLGNRVNTNVDAAVAAKRAQRDAARQHLEEIRAKPAKRGSVGEAWDYERFPEGPGRRWRPGDPPDMPSGGNYPTFSTVRKRVWRNLAHNELEARKAGNAARYTGRAPDITPVEGLSNAELLEMRRTGASRPGFEIEHSRIPQRVGRMFEEAGLPPNDARRLSKSGDPSNLDPLPEEMHAVVDERANQYRYRNPTLKASIDDRIAHPLQQMRNDEIQDLVDAITKNKIDLASTEAGRRLRVALQDEKSARGASARWAVP